jgi:hypothetical protein
MLRRVAVVSDVEAEALSNNGDHPKTINGLDTCTSREPPDGRDSSNAVGGEA